MESNNDILIAIGRMEGKIDTLNMLLSIHNQDIASLKSGQDRLVPLLTIVEQQANTIASLQADNESNKKWRWYTTGVAAAAAGIISLLAKAFPPTL